MLEQDKRSQPANSGTDNLQTQQVTQLEGIRQKVYMDRYSLKDPSGQALDQRDLSGNSDPCRPSGEFLLVALPAGSGGYLCHYWPVENACLALTSWLLLRS